MCAHLQRAEAVELAFVGLTAVAIFIAIFSIVCAIIYIKKGLGPCVSPLLYGSALSVCLSFKKSGEKYLLD